MLNEDALAIKTEYGNLTLDAYWYVSLYAYQMNTRPVFELVSGMLRKALAKLGDQDVPLLRSDQGWQYQMPAYRRLLEQHGLTQSMSRRTNCYDNGKDERFHHTLKAEVLERHAFTTHAHVQQELERWRHVYNTERPHEALRMATPLTRYKPGLRAMPEHLPEPEYSPGDEVLRVNSNGLVRLRGNAIKLSIALKGLNVAARPKDDEDGIVELWFAHQRVARLDLNATKP
jgi:hypothetical protein